MINLKIKLLKTEKKHYEQFRLEKTSLTIVLGL